MYTLGLLGCQEAELVHLQYELSLPGVIHYKRQRLHMYADYVEGCYSHMTEYGPTTVILAKPQSPRVTVYSWKPEGLTSYILGDK